MKKYPEYKDSGIEWLTEIPAKWKIIQCRHLINSLLNGTTQTQVDFQTDFRVTRIETISQGVIDYKKTGFIEYFENLEKFLLNSGDILLSHINSYEMVGNCAQYNDKQPLYHGMNLLRLQPSEAIVHRYLLYLFKSYFLKCRLKSICKHAINQVSIPTLAIKHIKVPKPDLQEQTAIANFLDQKTQQIDDLIERKQRLIELLKEERTAVINHAVTKGLDPNVPMKDSGIEWLGEIPEHWETRRLATMGRFSKGKGISRAEVKAIGFPCVRYGEIYTDYNRVVYSTKSFIDKESSLKSEIIKKGDVLFTASGETIDEIGKSIVYYGEEKIYAGGDIIIMKLGNELLPLYSSFLLESSFVIQQKANYGRGGIIVHISSKNLREVLVPLPSVKEQNNITLILETKTTEIDLQIAKIRQEMSLLNEYKISLVNEVVTGKIKVTDDI